MASRGDEPPSILACGSAPRLLFAVALAVSAAMAAPGVGSAQTDEERVETQRLFTAGVRAAREGHWAEARDAFSQAYAIVPNPTILVNLAAAQSQLGEGASAYRAYQRVLRDSESTAAHREVATSALAELELLVPRVRLAFEGWQRGDRLELDGEIQPDFDSASVLRVDEGEHRVAVVRGARRLGETTFVAEVGAESRVQIVLPDDPALALPLQLGTSGVDAQPSDPGPVLLGVGIPTLIAGIGLGVAVSVAYAFDGSCAESMGEVCTESWSVPIEGGVTWAVVAGALTIAGLSMVIAGASGGGSAELEDTEDVLPERGTQVEASIGIGLGAGHLLLRY